MSRFDFAAEDRKKERKREKRRADEEDIVLKKTAANKGKVLRISKYYAEGSAEA